MVVRISILLYILCKFVIINLVIINREYIERNRDCTFFFVNGISKFGGDSPLAIFSYIIQELSVDAAVDIEVRESWDRRV